MAVNTSKSPLGKIAVPHEKYGSVYIKGVELTPVINGFQLSIRMEIIVPPNPMAKKDPYDCYESTRWCDPDVFVYSVDEWEECEEKFLEMAAKAGYIQGYEDDMDED